MSVTQPAPERERSQGVRLEYVGTGSIVVRGPVSGLGYAFASGQAAEVDSRDVDALRRTRLFR